jgi:hypothetical protein
LWTVRIKNTSDSATYYDLAYATEYEAPSGTVVRRRRGHILDRLQPGQTRTFEVNDGFINAQATRASFVIEDANKVLAERRR